MGATSRKLHFAILSLSFISATLTGPAGLSQTSLDEVHIAPRGSGEAKAAPVTLLDPTLDAHAAPIKKDVNLVLVPVTITDAMGRMVVGLEKDNFQVFEGKREQEIQNVSSGDMPVSVGIIFDISGSMKDKMDESRNAIEEFCKTANPQDEFFLVTFSDRPQLAVDFTSQPEDLQQGLLLEPARGRTALLDAVYLGVEHMRQAKYEKKALLIISDGGDNHSRYSERDIRSVVEEADVMTYAIGIYDPHAPTLEERFGPELLTEIAELSGGRAFALGSPGELPAVASMISSELRSQYLLAYRPSETHLDGKWHKIKVKLHIPKGWPFLHVNARTGYYAFSR
jgi:Ca-activated chloride channel family protein